MLAEQNTTSESSGSCMARDSNAVVRRTSVQFFSACGSCHCSEPTRGRAKGMPLKLRVLLGSAVLFATPGTVVARGPAGPPASRGGRAATPDRNKRLTNKTSGKKYARMDRSSVVSQLIHPLTQELLVEKNNRVRNWPDTAPKCHPWS